MALPTPKYPLDDSCSTLFNNTLYTYTSEAFQSLPITQGAEWTVLAMGVPVTGGVCVQSTPGNDTQAAALYIVGGTSNSSSYNGLQRYTFADAKWETLQPNVPVTQNRRYHNAIYLNSSDSILMFAGSQDGTEQYSTQTFTIQAYEPYNVLSYRADITPAISPLLMPWTDSKAVYIGGSDTNTKAMIFSPADGWVDSNATLAIPFYNSSNIKSVIIDGDDSSKSLYTFDMSVSPNSVNRTILVDGSGNPVQNAKVIVSRSIEARLDERSASLEQRSNLTVATWPAYNGSLVPTATRTSWSLAEDQSGLVVISGGDSDDVLCMFQAKDNAWANATSILTESAAQNVLSGEPSGTSSPMLPTTTTASTSETSTTATPAASTGSGSAPPFPVKILGAVLGSILGAALILILILFLLRWRRNRREYVEAGHQRRASGTPNEKDNMDFADRGMPQLSSARQFQGHEKNTSESSFSSMAILMGRVGHKRGNGSVGSDSSSQFNKKYKTAISKPMPQERNLGPLKERPREEAVSFAEDRAASSRPRGPAARRGSTRRSSGWNRYWSGGSAMNILGFGSKRTTYADDSESLASDNRLPSTVTQASALPNPLNLGGQPQVNRVASGSPAHHSSRFPLTREMSGQIERPGSGSSTSSYADDRYDAYSSGVPASAHDHESWTPIDRTDWSDGRTQSSNYSDSLSPSGRITGSHLTRDLRFPTPPTSNRPPQTSSNNDMSWLNLGADRV